MQYTMALGSARDGALRAALKARADSSQFTIQLGAFRSRAGAEVSARQAASLGAGLGLGRPRIDTKIDALGRRLYVVQIGAFRNRLDAVQAHRRLGSHGVITSPLASVITPE